MARLRGSFAAVLLGLLAVAAAPGAQAAVTVAALTGWPPFSAQHLRAKGFANDILATALRRTGHEVRVEMMPWPRAVRLVKAGERDVLSSVWYTDARTRKMAFTAPIARNRLVFVTRRADAFSYTGLDSLTGKTVGVAEDYHYTDAFMQAEHFTRTPAPTLLANLFKVDTGQVDMTVADELIARYLIEENEPRFEHPFAMTDTALSARELRAAVSRKIDNTQEILRAIDNGIAAMRADGTYAHIKREHGLAE
ncbi:transporter substrate-binding domain-containing protein [Limimonas halophila]|nr:transporter substrate-binding domain-containing protein [Limimonas halophila]